MATARYSKRSPFVPRTPNSEGPDVVYNGSDHDIYVDGRYLGSRANSQDAWIEARRVHLQNVETAAIESADTEAEIAESAELEAYAAEWDAAAESQRETFERGRNSMLTSIIAFAKTIEPDPEVTVEHHVCEDDPYLVYDNYTCNGVSVQDDGASGFDVSNLIDLDCFTHPSESGTYTLRGYTDLEGLKRIRKALWVIVTKIEQRTHGTKTE